MQPRPPIVTILGHVDHGKTTLLDYLRKSRIAAKEHGGITQRIGAYEVETGIKGYPVDKITFIDTPGHEAFSQLRSRGATVADIAILIIDAKDSIKPQTIESIQHIKSAKIPFVVALNKIDLPDSKPDKVQNDLLKYEVVTESKGGNVPTVKISAKTGAGIPELLESILLMSGDLNLQYDTQAAPKAYIIETKRDKRGIIPSAIIKEGVMHVGDTVYSFDKKAKVRALINDVGKQVREVHPSTPFELLGFEEMPEVGSEITTTAGTAVKTTEEDKQHKMPTMYDFLNKKEDTQKKLSLVIKSDSQGSLEAIIKTLEKNTNIDIILNGVGDVHRSDIFLAKTTKAIIIGFNTNIDNEVQELAKQEKVVIKTYNIIYELLDELDEVSQLIKEKEEQEKYVKGEAKIVATFIIEGEKIFGVKINKGKFNLADNVELFRDNNSFGKTRLVSLKQRAKSVQEVKKDQEAGMIFAPTLDLRVGDVVKSIS